MRVILKDDVDKIGKIGDVINVKDGYARNFLIPKKLAVIVNSASLKVVESQKKAALLRAGKAKETARKLADKLAAVSCTISKVVGENDKIYGSVTTADIAEALKQENIIVDKRDIVLDNDIDKLGIYSFKVKLHPEVVQQVKLWVVKQ